MFPNHKEMQMPPQVATKNAALDKLAKKGLAKATQAHATDETKYGSGGELSCPVAGIAQLTEVRFGEYQSGDNKGEQFVYFNGIAKTPESEVGKRVSKMVPLVAEKPRPNSKYPARTFDDRVAEALNTFRVLGGDDITAEMKTDADWLTVMEALTVSGVHFRYHTWPGKLNEKQTKENETAIKAGGKPIHTPYVNVEYDHAVDASETNGEAHTTAVDDNTASDTNDATEGSSEAPSDDWEALGETAAADDGSDECQAAKARILEKAEELGIKDAVESADTWPESANLVTAALEGGGSDEGDAGEAWKPEEGQEYKLKLPGHKKIEEYSVTKVFASTLNLKRKSDDKVFKAIAWGNDPDTIGNQQIG